MTRREALRRVRPLAVVAAGVLAVAGCGGSSSSSAPETESTAAEPQAPVDTPTQTTAPDSTPPPAPPEVTVMRIVVTDGRARGGIRRLDVAKGDRVRLVVVSDTTDEVHLHGYDLTTDVAPGRQGRIVFVAKVPGRFEIELEEAGAQIGELEVRP